MNMERVYITNLVTTLLLGIAVGCASESREETATDQAALSVAAPAMPSSTVDDVRRVAASALAGYLESIPEGHEQEYGFADRGEFKQASLGQPYEMFELADNGTVKPLEYWRIPVMVAAQSRAFLDVKQSNGKYEAFSIGAAGLANELSRIESSRATGPNKAIFRSHSKRADFAAFGADARKADARSLLRIVPLRSAEQALGQKLGSNRKRAPGALSTTSGGRAKEFDMDELRKLLAE